MQLSMPVLLLRLSSGDPAQLTWVAFETSLMTRVGPCTVLSAH